MGTLPVLRLPTELTTEVSVGGVLLKLIVTGEGSAAIHIDAAVAVSELEMKLWKSLRFFIPFQISCRVIKMTWSLILAEAPEVKNWLNALATFEGIALLAPIVVSRSR